MGKIFVLENDPIFGRLFAYYLEKAGYEVTRWPCIQGAADVIKSGDFDLLIVDIILPFEPETIGSECEDGGIRVLESLTNEGFALPKTLFASVLPDVKERVKALNLPNSCKEEVPNFDKNDWRELLGRVRGMLSTSAPED